MNGDKATPVAAAKPRRSKITAASHPARIVKVENVKSNDVAAVEPAPRVTADDVSAKTFKAVDVSVAAVEEPEETVKMAKQQVKLNAGDVPPVDEPVAQSYEAVAAFNRDYMETVIESANAFAKGFEVLGSEWWNYAQVAVENGMATSKALMDCKSVDEAVEIQSGYVASALDRYLTESAKLTELSVKLTNGAIEPLNQGFVVAVRDITQPAMANRRDTP